MKFNLAALALVIAVAGIFAAPSVTITSPESGQTVYPPVQLTMAYNAGNSGPPSVDCAAYLGGVQVTQYVKIADHGSTVASYPPMPGQNDIHVYCKSDAGNFTYDFYHSFNVAGVDKVYPTVRLYSPDNNYYHAPANPDEPLSFSFMYDKGTSNIEYANCYLEFYTDDKAKFGTYPEMASAASGIYTTMSAPVPYGVRHWAITCYDPSEVSIDHPVSSELRNISVRNPAKVMLELPANKQEFPVGASTEEFSYSYVANGGPTSAYCSLFIDALLKNTRQVHSGESNLVGVDLSSYLMGYHYWNVACSQSDGWNGSSDAIYSGETRSFLIAPDWLDQWYVAIDSPQNGDNVKMPSDLKFTYYKGGNNHAPDVWCAAYLNGDVGQQLTDYYGASSGQQVSMPLPNLSGPVSMSVLCENNALYVWSAPVSFYANNSGNAGIVLLAPQNGYKTPVNKAVPFTFAYSSGGNAALDDMDCNVEVYAPNSNSLKYSTATVSATSGSTASVTETVGVPVSSSPYTWGVVCTSTGAGKQAVLSGKRQIYFQEAEVINPPTPPTPPSGPGGGGGTGSGGASFFPPRPSGAAAETGGRALVATNVTVNETKPAVATATIAGLDVPKEGYVNDTIILLLKSEAGTPLAAVDMFIKVPNSTLSIKVTTDSLGKAAYVPPVPGVYTYRAAGYNLTGNPSTNILQRLLGKAKSGDMGQLLNWLLILIAVLILIAIAVTGWMLLGGRKNGKEGEAGSAGAQQ